MEISLFVSQAVPYFNCQRFNALTLKQSVTQDQHLIKWICIKSALVCAIPLHHHLCEQRFYIIANCIILFCESGLVTAVKSPWNATQNCIWFLWFLFVFVFMLFSTLCVWHREKTFNMTKEKNRFSKWIFATLFILKSLKNHCFFFSTRIAFVI